MEKAKKSLRTVIFSLIFCALYIIFALRPLGTELNLTPEWTVNIESTSPVAQNANFIPFKLGQDLGYFTDDGKISLCVNFPYKATVSENYYATFGGSNAKAAFVSANGTPLGDIAIDGFPYFDQDRIFVFLPGGTSFCQCDVNGNEVWRYEYYAPLTAFDSCRNGSVAGFADGRIVAFDSAGNKIQDFTADGSDYPVVLGVGISPDAEMTASVCGQKKQRLIITKAKQNHTQIFFHEYLDDEIYEQVPVEFSRDGNTLYYGCKGGLGIVDIKKRVSSKLKIEGHISQIVESESNGFVFVLSHSGSVYTVTILEPFDSKAGEFSFEAQSAFIQCRGESLYIGRDKKISKLTVNRR